MSILTLNDYAQCALLLPFDGANNGVKFLDWSPNKKIASVSGDTKTVTSESKFYGSSVFFDGAGDDLSLSDDADLDFGSNDFTIAFWYFPISRATYSGILSRDGRDHPWAIYHGTSIGSGNLYAAFGDGSAWGVDDLTFGALADNTWHHIAITRSGNTFTSFVNGVSVTTRVWSGTVGSSVSPLTIGRNYTYYVSFNLQDLLIINGAALWTSAFTPPGSLIKTISGTISDSSGNPAERTVIAVPRTSPSRAFTTISSAVDGSYAISVPDVECSRIACDDAVTAPILNDIVDRVIPG